MDGKIEDIVSDRDRHVCPSFKRLIAVIFTYLLGPTTDPPTAITTASYTSPAGKANSDAQSLAVQLIKSLPV